MKTLEPGIVNDDASIFKQMFFSDVIYIEIGKRFVKKITFFHNLTQLPTRDCQKRRLSYAFRALSFPLLLYILLSSYYNRKRFVSVLLLPIL